MLAVLIHGLLVGINRTIDLETIRAMCIMTLCCRVHPYSGIFQPIFCPKLCVN